MAGSFRKVPTSVSFGCLKWGDVAPFLAFETSGRREVLTLINMPTPLVHPQSAWAVFRPVRHEGETIGGGPPLDQSEPPLWHGVKEFPRAGW